MIKKKIIITIKFQPRTAWFDATTVIKPSTKQQLHLPSVHLQEKDMHTHMDRHSWCHTIKCSSNGRSLVTHCDVIQSLALSSNKPSEVKHCV